MTLVESIRHTLILKATAQGHQLSAFKVMQVPYRESELACCTRCWRAVWIILPRQCGGAALEHVCEHPTAN